MNQSHLFWSLSLSLSRLCNSRLFWNSSSRINKDKSNKNNKVLPFLRKCLLKCKPSSGFTGLWKESPEQVSLLLPTVNLYLYFTSQSDLNKKIPTENDTRTHRHRQNISVVLNFLLFFSPDSYFSCWERHSFHFPVRVQCNAFSHHHLREILSLETENKKQEHILWRRKTRCEVHFALSSHRRKETHIFSEKACQDEQSCLRVCGQEEKEEKEVSEEIECVSFAEIIQYENKMLYYVLFDIPFGQWKSLEWELDDITTTTFCGCDDLISTKIRIPAMVVYFR